MPPGVEARRCPRRSRRRRRASPRTTRKARRELHRPSRAHRGPPGRRARPPRRARDGGVDTASGIECPARRGRGNPGAPRARPGATRRASSECESTPSPATKVGSDFGLIEGSVFIFAPEIAAASSPPTLRRAAGRGALWSAFRRERLNALSFHSQPPKEPPTRPRIPSDAAIAMGWYLAYFMHRHLDFRRQELRALADLHGAATRCGGASPSGTSSTPPCGTSGYPATRSRPRSRSGRQSSRRPSSSSGGRATRTNALNASIDGDDESSVPRSRRVQAFLAEGVRRSRL